MAIPLANPRASYLEHQHEIDAALARVLGGNSLILGPETEAFEKEFAAYIGVGYGVGVGNGTDALHLALRACDVGIGDEVITVSHTAVAPVVAIELCGARPVLVDIDPTTYTLDSSQIEAALTAHTKAIIAVHLYGHPAPMKQILEIAGQHGLPAVEDCAQAHGAEYLFRKMGAWGDIAAFSFYPTKNLGALGDGGMIITDDPQLAEKVRLLREYGWRERYVSEIPGCNSRLDELQAAALRVKLHYLDEDNARRIQLRNRYCRQLASTSLVLPAVAPSCKHVYHLFVIRSRRRDELQSYLRKRGIDTLVHYPVPVHRQPAYHGRLINRRSLRESETAATEVLSLPMYPQLQDREVDSVVEAILSFERS